MDFEYLTYRLFLVYCSIRNKIKGIFGDIYKGEVRIKILVFCSLSFWIGVTFILLSAICVKPKATETKENDIKVKQMMIIEDHLTGKIDTVWIDPKQNKQ